MSFPADFIWGTSTSSYQIEGAPRADGKGPSIWDEFCRFPGKVFRGHTGDTACDHYYRYREDIGLMADVGVGFYRFSVSWPRVLPEGTGTVNPDGLDFYDRLVDGLLESGIQPFITLYHWDLPWALQIRGGWLNPDSPDWFAEYSRTVVEKLSDRVRHWLTLNEPQVFIGLAYGLGIHAPGYQLSLRETLLAGHHALLAHGKSVQVIRQHSRQTSQIGWAPVGLPFMPATSAEEDIEAARRATFEVPAPTSHDPAGVQSATWNTAWWTDPVFNGQYPQDGIRNLEPWLPAIAEGDMELISQPLDFFGCNIYHAQTVRADGRGGFEKVLPPAGGPRTMMQWDVTPDALYWGTRFFHERYGLPIHITENGMALTEIVTPGGRIHDSARIEFLRQYLTGAERALAEGIPVAGYFAWSFLDNFEWSEGYAQRFGLVHVDFETQKRTLKDSAYFYKELIASNGSNLRTANPVQSTLPGSTRSGMNRDSS